MTVTRRLSPLQVGLKDAEWVRHSSVPSAGRRERDSVESVFLSWLCLRAVLCHDGYGTGMWKCQRLVGRNGRSAECGVLIELVQLVTWSSAWGFCSAWKDNRFQGSVNIPGVQNCENENKMKNQISFLRPFPGPSLAGAAREDLYFKGLLAEHLHSRVSSLGVLGGRFEPS